MNDMLDAAVALVLAIIAAIVWLVRLEAGQRQASQRLDRLQEDFDVHIDRNERLYSKMLEDLSSIKESTAQIKGYLSMPERKP